MWYCYAPLCAQVPFSAHNAAFEEVLRAKRHLLVLNKADLAGASASKVSRRMLACPSTTSCADSAVMAYMRAHGLERAALLSY